jgi:hypothetical protein
MKLPEILYHRTNSAKDVESILEKGYIIPSRMLKKKETISGSRLFDYISFTEAKCNDTGGRIQFKMKADKINDSNLFNIWHKIRDECIESIKRMEHISGFVPPQCTFLNEFEWRTRRNIPIPANKDTVEEIVLYENYVKAKHLLEDPKFTKAEKIKNTMYRNRLTEMSKKYNIPFRSINMECTNEERLKEFEDISGISRNYKIINK